MEITIQDTLQQNGIMAHKQETWKRLKYLLQVLS